MHSMLFLNNKIFFLRALRSLPVVAKRKSRYRGPVGPEDRTGAVIYNRQ